MDVRIAYASETGRAEALAWRCRSWLRLRNVTTSDPVPLDALTSESTTTIIFAATAGDGAPPSNGKKFWSTLLRKGAPRLDGKRYALYGLGDARYGAKFNAFARRLDARLAQLGAARLCERSLGDACTVEGAESLLPGFFARLSPALGISESLEASLQGRVGDEAPDRVEDYAPPVTIKMVDEGSTIQAYERRLLAKEGCASIAQATLSTTQRLTDENWWQEVRHVVFSASVTYAPGDVAVLVPRNAPRHVQAVLRALQKNDRTISLQTPVTSSLVNGTVEDVLSTCLDLATPLPQRSLGILALFVVGEDDTSKEQRQKLKELATVQGGPLYRDYVRSERRGVADVLVDFDRCAPSLEALLDACPRLRPRHYSIASCSTDTIELCVARALLETPLGRKVYGLCSSWLCDLREGTLLIGVRRGEFSPIEQDPLVFVGPGTGVAPARAFARSQPRNDMLLFFGCRHESKDRLYADEFAGLSKLEVDVSVSRHTDASQRRYVTKALRARATDVAHWILDRNARFYIAGNAKMAADVALALCDCLAPRCGGSQKAAALLRRLEREGRFATEAFG
ncbi:unnamed protein product [Pelagomonas calceolata]|uniref:Flavodoxin-like domain-containing protein n=1 Tax=Pelagomonas calceolata TaxID=35677 RepID=A0A7S4A6A6_9STRA|nr:unnamed protein product [Pelagomonas calceolata]